MTKKLKRIRRNIVNSKIWIQRSMSWVAILNAGMILFLVLSKFQDYGLNIHITKWIVPIYLGVIILLIIFGYLEDKMGFFREEIYASQKRNPYMKEIIDRLDKIEQKIDKK